MRISDWSSDVCSSDLFDPHRLPDAADRGVPDAGGVEDLLAARLGARARRVEDLDDQLILARLQIGGDVETEGVEAALVRADDRSVDAHGRFIVDRKSTRLNSSH